MSIGSKTVGQNVLFFDKLSGKPVLEISSDKIVAYVPIIGPDDETAEPAADTSEPVLENTTTEEGGE